MKRSEKLDAKEISAKERRTIRRNMRRDTGPETVPFDSAEEAWFWFIQAQAARNDGARFTMGAGLVPRPCEPMDILKVVDRLYRNRRLIMDHLLVLRHYGRRMLPPDPARIKEGRSYRLWKEAMDRMAPMLKKKHIIRPGGDRDDGWFKAYSDHPSAPCEKAYEGMGR